MSLHACGNCRHFVSRGAVRCLLPGTERVLDHQAANRCLGFEFASVAQAPERSQAAGAGDLNPRARWDSLFK